MEPDIIEYFLAHHDWWGVLLPVVPPMIVYDPKQSSARYESTIMHELAHIYLNHPTERIHIAPDGIFESGFNSVIETEAAYLGSCLQIPRRGLLWALQMGLN